MIVVGCQSFFSKIQGRFIYSQKTNYNNCYEYDGPILESVSLAVRVVSLEMASGASRFSSETVMRSSCIYHLASQNRCNALPRTM